MKNITKEQLKWALNRAKTVCGILFEFGDDYEFEGVYFKDNDMFARYSFLDEYYDSNNIAHDDNPLKFEYLFLPDEELILIRETNKIEEMMRRKDAEEKEKKRIAEVEERRLYSEYLKLKDKFG